MLGIFLTLLLAQATPPPGGNGPITCSLTSTATTCVFPVIGKTWGSPYNACTLEVSGTWTGQVDFVRMGFSTSAPTNGTPPSSATAQSNSTSNGSWNIGLVNATEFITSVDNPITWTGTATVTIVCNPAQHSV